MDGRPAATVVNTNIHHIHNIMWLFDKTQLVFMLVGMGVPDPLQHQPSAVWQRLSFLNTYTTSRTQPVPKKHKTEHGTNILKFVDMCSIPPPLLFSDIGNGY